MVPQPGGYGPVSVTTPFSSALSARCVGAAGYNASGIENVFAGTETELFRLNNATPTNISRSGGYQTTKFWRFCLFGSRVIATNLVDDVQTYVIGQDTQFSDMNTAAPKAKYCATVGNFVMLAHTNDPTDGEQAKRLWWSGLENPTVFPTPGTNEAIQQQSDFQDLYGDQGDIKALIPGLFGCDALAMQERGLTRINYVGISNGIFQFDPIEGARGCFAPNSPIISGGIVYYPGEDGFYATDGNTTRQIGDGKCDRFFFEDLGASDPDRIYGAADPRRKLLYWIYPDSSSSDLVPNRAIAYHYELDEFSYIDGWEAQVIFPSFSFSRLVDDVSDLVDTVDIPVDDPVWQGGRQILGFIDSQNRLAYASGATLEARVQSGDFSPGTERNRGPRAGRITELWPVVDGGNPRGRLFYSDRLNTTRLASEAETAQSNVGYCPQNVRGRYFQARVRMPRTNDWNHIQGFETNWIAEGSRG